MKTAQTGQPSAVGQLPDIERWCTLPNGLEIACQSEMEAHHIYEDLFVQKVYFKHGISLWDGACVFDVGGNIGLFTLFVHQHFRELSTYTFEPAPPLFAILQANTRHCDGALCKLFNYGLSDTSGVAELTFYPYSSGMSSFYGDADEEKDVLRTIFVNQHRHGVDDMEQIMPNSEELLEARVTSQSFECPLLPLSRVIHTEEVDTIDLLKIDVQKSELDVLRGIEPGHWPKIRQVVMEVHDLDGQLELATEMLKSHGFTVAVEQDLYYQGSVMYNLFAINKDIYTSTSGDPRGGAAGVAEKARGQRQRQALARLRRLSRRR